MCPQTKKPYNLLYGQSYLQKLGIELKFLDELESLFIIKEALPRFRVRSNYRVQTQCVIDISEKIGFLYLALDYIKQLEGEGKRYNWRLIKYHFYNFVYDCKACLDSIAVLLNHQLNLGFKGGNRDFRKTEFRRALEKKSTFFKDFSSKFSSWCDGIIEYRDRIIHQIGVGVFQVPEVYPHAVWNERATASLPYCIDKKAISFIERMSMDFSEIAKVGHVEIVTFCEEAVKNTMDIAEMALSEIYNNIMST